MTQFVTEAVREHGPEGPEDEEIRENLEGMVMRFGSVSTGMISLYQAISGGKDWDDFADPLAKGVSPLLLYMFCLYTAFFYFAVLNVVTGMFCTEAISVSAEDRDHLVEDELRKTMDMVSQFKQLFAEVDADGDGEMTWAEFKSKQNDARVLGLFKYLELDIAAGKALFEIIDAEK